MSAPYATAFPVYASPFQFEATIYDMQSGNPEPGLAVSLFPAINVVVHISLDNGTPITLLPVTEFKLSGVPGTILITLSAAYMTAHSILVSVSSTIANTYSPIVSVRPLNLQSIAPVWQSQSPELFEQIGVQSNGYMFNQQIGNTTGQTQTVYNRDGSILATGTLEPTQTGTTRGQLS
jgi:hypothetical protein